MAGLKAWAGATPWGLLILVLVSIFLIYIDRSDLSVAAPLIESEFELSPANTDLLFSACCWVYAPLQFFGFAGWLEDRFPSGIALAVGLVLWPASTAAAGLGELAARCQA